MWRQAVFGIDEKGETTYSFALLDIVIGLSFD
jgi:hypothetical protein